MLIVKIMGMIMLNMLRDHVLFLKLSLMTFKMRLIFENHRLCVIFWGLNHHYQWWKDLLDEFGENLV